MEYWKDGSIIGYIYAIIEYTPSPSHISYSDNMAVIPYPVSEILTALVDHYEIAAPAVHSWFCCPHTTLPVHTALLVRVGMALADILPAQHHL